MDNGELSDFNILFSTTATSAIDVQAGHLRFGDFVNNGSITTALGTEFESQGAGILTNSTTGTIGGAGTIDTPAGGLTNDGTINAGTSPDILIIDGDLDLTTNSIINIEIEGTTPGANPGGHDQIQVTGTATLDGTLNVTLPGAFDPGGGDTFTMMTFASRVGTFAVENPPAGKSMTVNYNAGDIVLSNIVAGCGGTICWDGDIDNFWTTLGNWTDDLRIPDGTDNVEIDIGGGNTITLNSGAQTIASVVAAEDIDITGGGVSLTVTGVATFNGTLTVTSGSANLTGGGTVADLDIVNGTLDVDTTPLNVTDLAMLGSGAVLTGDSEVTVTSSGLWNIGTMSGTGRTIIGGGATLDLSTTSTKTWDVREIENLGVINWNDGSVFISNGPLMDNQGTFNVLLGATNRTFDFTGGALGTFTNTGTFIGNTGGAIATFDMAFDHTSVTAAAIQAGTVVLNDGGTSTGDFTVQGGAGLAFLTAGSETHTLSGSVSGAGSVTLGSVNGVVNLTASSTYDIGGQTEIFGGTSNFDGTLLDLGVRLPGTNGVGNFDETNGPIVHGLDDLDIVNAGLFFNANDVQTTNLTMTGSDGVLGGTADVTVTSSGLWNIGLMSGTGRTIIGGGATLELSTTSTKTWDVREIENLGVINWNDGSVFISNGPLMDNQGTFNVLLGATNRTFDFTGGALGTFTNTGTFIGNTGGAIATFDMAFDHTSVTAADIQAGTVVLNDGGTSTGDFTVQGGAGLAFLTAGSETHTLSGSVSGAGSVTLGSVNGVVNLTASSTYDIGGQTEIFGGTSNFDGTLLDLGVRLLGTNGVANFDETNGPIVHGLDDLDIVNAGLFFNANDVQTTNLTMTGSGGVLGGTADVTVTSSGLWNIGLMSGTGRTIIGGGATLELSTTSTKTWDVREIENLGVINWNDGSVFISNGPLMDNQGTFNVLLGATNRTFDFTGGALGTFTNTGTFIGNTGGAIATFDMAFDHTSVTAADIQAGTVVLNDGGTSTGDFTVQGGAGLAFLTAGSETHTLSGSVSGAGSVTLGSVNGVVNLTASSTYDIGGQTEIFGGTSNFDGTLLDLGVRLLGTNGVANFDETNGPIVHGLDDLDIVNAGLFFNANDVQTTNLTMTGSDGVLGGTADVTVTSSGLWNIGLMSGTGRTIIGGGATLDLSTTSTKTWDVREIENQGIINWNDGSVFISNGPLMDNQGTFNVLLGATNRTFDFNGGALGTFTNTGTFIGNTGGAIATFDMAFDHTSVTAAAIQAGTVVFNDGGTSTGDFTVQGGAGLAFLTAGSETHTLSGSVSGAGSVTLGSVNGTVDLTGTSTYDIGGTPEIFGGTSNFDGTLLDLGVRLLGTNGVANFDETNGPIVHGLDDLDIVNAGLFFNANDVQTTNLTMTGGSGVLGGTTDVTVTSSGLWNIGLMSGTGRTIIGGGATLDLSTTSTKTWDVRESENQGIINWNDGSVFISNGPLMDNQGTFNVLLGASNRTFDFNGGLNGTFSNSGTLNSSTGGAIATFDPDFTNTGLVDVQAGPLVFTTTYNQTAGTTQLTGGSLTATTQPINIDGGTLAGAGTITADVDVDNGGILSPGTSPDIVIIDGDLTLGPGSKTDIEIIGTTPGPTGFDQIQVSGNVVLDGELEVFLPNTPPFDPTGNAFQIFLCGTTAGTCSGTFATITPPFGTTFNVDVNANDVELNTFVVSPVNTWIGAVDDFWNVIGNWSLGTIPVIGEAVLIDESVDAVTTTITIDGATTAQANQLSSTKNFNMTGGTFDVTNNSDVTADLTMSAGTTTLGGALDVQTVTITGGTLTVNGTATVNADLTVNGTGVTNLNGAASVAGTLSQTGGTTNLNAAATYNISSLDLSSSAILSVTDAATLLDIDTAFDFDQGSINGLGTVNLSAGSTAQLTGFNSKTVGAGVTLSNDTTFNFVSTNSLTLEGTLNNNNLAVLDLQGNVGIAGNGTMNNLAGGTIVKSAGAGTSILLTGAGTTNSGLIDVQSGTLQFTTGAAHTGGELRLTSGNATVIGGTHTFDATSSITDPGLDNNLTVQNAALLSPWTVPIPWVASPHSPLARWVTSTSTPTSRPSQFPRQLQI